MKWSPKTLKYALGIYGPFLGAGIKMDYISPDWREARVSMKLRWYNRNIMGVHFGGSLYSMVDPQLMLMLMNILGKDYAVWDKAASIEFIKPGKGKVSCLFTISDTQIQDIRSATASGEKYLPEFQLCVVDENGDLVARINKVVYIRKKQRN